MRRAVLHLDLDAFFASVEQRDKPSLRGKPVIVGGLGWRGVVSTASYEARVFDVGSAMPMALARRRAPHAACLSPRFDAYRRASSQVMALVAELSGVVEPLSLDEAYVDLADQLAQGAPLGSLLPAVQGFRARVRETTGLTVSVGLAASKLLAKVASDLGKPDGCVVVEPGTEAAVLAPMGVRALPGVGAATQARLAKLGLTTVGQVAATDERELVGLLGRAAGSALSSAARGVDARRVVAEREAKSVSAEETFATDLTDRALLEGHVRRLADRVGARLGPTGVSARTVTLKVRRYDFSALTRSVTPGRPFSGAPEVAEAARSLLAAVDVADGVRLVGVGVSGFTEHVQEDLLAALEAQLAAASVADDPAADPGDDPGGAADVPTADGGDPAADGSPDHPSAAPAAPAASGTSAPARTWRPGQDVVHAERGPGWVQGSGVGRVTVRFEGPHTGVGRATTFAVDDEQLSPADPPAW